MLNSAVSLLLILTSLLLSALPARAGESGLSVRYHFRNDAFVLKDVELTLDATGRGQVVFERQGLSKPVKRQIVVREAVVQQLVGLIDRMAFLDSSEEYQSEKQHPNLGTTLLAVSNGTRSRTVSFNYTENRDAEALVSLLRGLAAREISVFEIETSARHAPLDVPKQIQTLEQEIKLGRITDAAALIPLLRELADDMALPLMARNRAAKLAERLEKLEN